jgi:MFS family permease
MIKKGSLVARIRVPRLFFGWWINIVTALLCGISSGFVQQGSSVFFKSISADLNLSRAATSVASGVSALQSGSLFPFVGWLADKVGARWIVIPGMLIMSTGLVLMKFISSPWQYYLVWGLIVSGGNTVAFTIVMDKMLTSWFISKRGLAFGIRFTIMGLTIALLLPLISWLSVTQGWRNSSLIWAGVVLAEIPLALYFVKQKRPEYYGLLPDGAEMKSGATADQSTMIAEGVEYAANLQEQEFSLGQSMKTPAFWLLAVASVVQSIFWGFSVHMIPFLTDRGIDPIAAGSIVAMTSLLAIPARLFGGIIADHVPKTRMKFLLVGTYILLTVGVSTFLLMPTAATVYVFLILWWFGNGAYTPTSIVIISRYFGRKAYGSIQGILTIFSVPISILSPIYMGRIYDVTGSYTNVFVLFSILAVVNAVVMSLIRAPKLPELTNSTAKAAR